MTYIKYFPKSNGKFTKSQIPNGQSRYIRNSILYSCRRLYTQKTEKSLPTQHQRTDLHIIFSGNGGVIYFRQMKPNFSRGIFYT